MLKEDCFYLGKISKKFSFRGEVLAFLDTDEPRLYYKMESVFVERNKQLVPFSVTKCSPHKDKFVKIKFEDIDSEEKAEEIIGSELFLPLSTLPKLTGNKFYYHEVIGFEIEDQKEGIVGVIQSVNDSSAQPLFEVLNGKIQLLIPIIDQFLIEVDRENRKVVMNLPEGLTSMYA